MLAAHGGVLQTHEMRFSLQVRYAIGGVFDLAYNTEREWIHVRVISERQRIPERYLEQLFRRLRRAGLLEARRGPGGGYRLARSPDAITLRDVVEAIEGSLARPPRPSRLPPAKETASRRGRERNDFTPGFLWPVLAERVAGVLGAITLDGLCRDARRAGVPPAHSRELMYFI